jgi:hypothetical protein
MMAGSRKNVEEKIPALNLIAKHSAELGMSTAVAANNMGTEL